MSVYAKSVHTTEPKVVEIYSKPPAMASLIAYALCGVKSHVLHHIENMCSIKISKNYNLSTGLLRTHSVCRARTAPRN